MRRDPTLHDVARKVGVSTRTVSRVVNGEGGFSSATEQRVQAAIEELGYRPNLLARGLISGRTGTIGVIGAAMGDPFFPEVADGVQRSAADLGLTMFFASTDNEPDRQRSVLDSLMSHAVDGVILFPALGTGEQIHAFGHQGLPMVTVDHVVTGPRIGSVSSDIVGGARKAVEHLRSTGRRRIGFIGATTSQRRRAGYVEALAPEASPIEELDEATAEGGMAATQRLLDRAADVDALFVYNDLMALGALRILSQSGRRVPDDVAVIGFDDIAVSAIVQPSLTTVRLDLERLGRAAIDLLLKLIDGEEPGEPVVLPVELVIRESA